MIYEVSPAIDITLHYTGGEPRAAPPVTTYFYRQNGATLRVASSAKATMPQNGTFTYHVDTGGYIHALDLSGRGGAGDVTLFIEVDGSYFSGLLSPAACRRWADHHLDLAKASQVPDLKAKHPLNMAAAEWMGYLQTAHRGPARGRPAGVNLRVLPGTDRADRNQERNQRAG